MLVQESLILYIKSMKTLFATKDGFIFSFLGKGGNIRAPWLRKIAGQLQPRRHRQGYLTISVQGKQKFIHRLVWEEFNGVIPKGLQINHKDGNKSNNHIDNLEL